MDLMTYALCKGNGGGGSSEPFVINITLNQEYTNVADKTYSEILSAFESGRELVCVRNGTKHVISGIRGNGDFTFSAKLEDTGYSTITITANNNISNIVHYFVPPASVDNKGKVLRGNSTGSFQPSDVDFTVTLTPTAQDLSGTMDKTPQEIFDAVDSGKRVVFSIPAFNAFVLPQQFLLEPTNVYVVAGQIIYTIDGVGDCIIHIATDSVTETYHTSIYPLTPLS